MAGKKKEEAVDEKKTEEKTAKNIEGKTSAKDAKPKKEAKARVTKTSVITKAADNKKVKRKTRKEKVGIVWSDKMTKTVVVRVERLVKHQMYHKYMKKRKKFMAHDELGAALGDRVRIVETRPLSARKRWRVVEIIQKAQR